MSNAPNNLSFSVVATVPYATLSPPLLRDVTEPFDADSGQFTKFSESTPATMSVGGGVVTITNSSGTDRNDLVVTGPSLTIPQCFVSIDIVDRSGSPGGYDNIGVGLIKDANNFVIANADRVNNEMRLQVKIGGTSNFYAPVSRLIGPGQKLGMALIGNSATVYVHDGSTWRYVTGRDVADRINFKTADLTGWKGGFSVATPGGGASWSFDNLIVGRFGGVAIRDITVVTLEGGSPHVESGKVYATATCSDGLGGGYQAVVRVNLSDHSIEQTGVIFTSRGGAKQNDVAGHIVAYPSGERKLTIGTWGNGIGNAIDTHYASTTDDLLSGSWLVSTTKLNLPVAAGKAAYDSFLVKDGASWRLAYTTCDNLSFAGSPFYSSLATSPDLATWTLVRNDPTTPYEGTKILKLSGDLYIAAGTSNAARAYDKELNYLGAINAIFSGGAQTQPHPMIFQAEPTKAVMLTSDNDQSFPGVTAGFTWGRMVVHEAPMTSDAGSANLQQPKSVVIGYDTLPSGSAAITQPMASIAGSGTRNTGVATIKQPPTRVTSAGFAGGVNIGVMAQPRARLAGTSGVAAKLLQPMTALSASGTTIGVGAAAFGQPSPSISANGTTGVVGRAIMFQPVGRVAARAGGRASLAGSLPRVSGFGLVGSVGQASMMQPRPAVVGAGKAWSIGYANLRQPRSRLLPAVVAALVQPRSAIAASGALFATAADGRTVWCFTPMVDKNGNLGGALTRWPNYPGHAMARTASATWVTSPSATYKMGGEADGEQLVQWSWDTALADFDVSQKKVMVSAYIGGVVPTCTTYRVSAGDSPKHSYGHEEYALQLRNHRQKFGRGRKARYLGFGLSGSGPLSVDTVEFEIVSTTRRI